MKPTCEHFSLADKLGLVHPFHSSSLSVDPNPQSGKSLFLIWLLIRRLAFRLPTALQVERDKAILFHGGGTSIFNDLQDVVPYLELEFENDRSRIWVLVDSNKDLEKPAAVFCNGLPFFVVEAASRPSRFEWAKKGLFLKFYMKTWTLSELLQAYVILLAVVHDTHYFCSRSYMGLSDESIVRYLFQTYRLPPRELIIYAKRPESFREHIVDLVRTMDIGAVRNALQSPDSDKSSHLITRVEPTPTRFSFKTTIASPFVFQQLWNYHLRSQISVSTRFYDIFCLGGTTTASSAGWIFESRMHQLLVQDYEMFLYPIGHTASTSKEHDYFSDYTNTKNRSNEKRFRLNNLQEETLGKGIKLEVNCYYRPERTNFAAIDSLLLIRRSSWGSSHILLMFKFTRNKDKHVAKESGLKEVDDLTVPEGTTKYYVVVTPSGIQPKIHAPKGRFVDKDEQKYVSVFHHPVERNRLFPS
jgi:hypothetical protein